jgi:hypothetical protein
MTVPPFFEATEKQLCMMTRLCLADMAAGGGISDRAKETKITAAETMMKVLSGLGDTAVQKPRAQTLGFCDGIVALESSLCKRGLNLLAMNSLMATMVCSSQDVQL